MNLTRNSDFYERTGRIELGWLKWMWSTLQHWTMPKLHLKLTSRRSTEILFCSLVTERRRAIPQYLRRRYALKLHAL